MKAPEITVEQPGIAFEKVVAAIQAQIDPAAAVSHNEILTDRLGQKRQFDVVVRGAFAGQKMLGVIECKDFKRKVGTPEVDAFVTKGHDINANFKILVSRRGFTRQALAKCKHYGIQALSLVSDDSAHRNFFIGSHWKADITRWAQIRMQLHFAQEPAEPVHLNVQDATIQGKKVVDWYTNYLIDIQDDVIEFGWVAGIKLEFDKPQNVTIRAVENHLCTAISFWAERVCDKRERLVGLNGSGFFDWQANQATFAPGATITTDAVPIDFSQWEPRIERAQDSTGFLEIQLFAREALECVPDALDLDQL